MTCTGEEHRNRTVVCSGLERTTLSLENFSNTRAESLICQLVMMKVHSRPLSKRNGNECIVERFVESSNVLPCM